jgi:hypothetical protein
MRNSRENSLDFHPRKSFAWETDFVFDTNHMLFSVEVSFSDFLDKRMNNKSEVDNAWDVCSSYVTRLLCLRTLETKK